MHHTEGALCVINFNIVRYFVTSVSLSVCVSINSMYVQKKGFQGGVYFELAHKSFGKIAFVNEDKARLLGYVVRSASW